MRIMVLGCPCSGKTNLINMYKGEPHDLSSTSYLFPEDFTMTVNAKSYKFTVCDTPAMWQDVIWSDIRQADAFILVFSIDFFEDHSFLSSFDEFMEEIMRVKTDQPNIFIIINKIDLIGELSADKLLEYNTFLYFLEKNGYPYLETSLLKSQGSPLGDILGYFLNSTNVVQNN